MSQRLESPPPVSEDEPMLPEGIGAVQPDDSALEQAALSTQKPELTEYKLLKGHRRTDGSYKTDDQLRSEYVRLTDELVRKMTEGVTVTDSQTGERSVQIPDAVVWLDKSARPLAWLTRDLWDTLARDEAGNVPEQPKSYFANIDREQWVNELDSEGNGHVDIDRLDPTVIRSLRSIYVEPKDKADGLTPAIDDAPAALDGKTVLIVDEVKASGRTLDYAQKLYGKAFPTAKIAGAHWMSGIATKGLASGNADLPVWYKANMVQGRGVADRDAAKSAVSPSDTQRLGSWFLSTPHLEAHPKRNDAGELIHADTRTAPERDRQGWQLRKELGRLALDVREGNMLVVPSYERDLDDADERALRLNPGLSTIEEFDAAQRELNAQSPR